MKKTIALILLMCLLCIACLSACQNGEQYVPTCDEVISAYKQAGYHVSHHENAYKDESSDELCYVKVWQDDVYDCVYFNFYETAEIAQQVDSESQWNGILYLFSIIFSDPTWVYSDSYGNIQYQYESPFMIQPFKDLISQK